MASDAVAVPETGRRSLNLKLVVGIFIIALAVAYLVMAALPSGAAYYMTVSELQQQGSAAYARQTRVAGEVVPGSIVRNPETLEVRFQIKDASGVLPVVYTGVVPDIFGDNIQVVVEGKYGTDGTYQADVLLAKCPSKFEAAPSGDG
jgi:cytochrome c-type biogenesis protein CcmE